MPDGNELVDVATGELRLAETDVMLPGVLPLVLDRCHRSSRLESSRLGGRWFGRSWMSSLDQRLQVSGERIQASFADAELLSWIPPRNAGDPPTIPQTGPVWPLLHSLDGSYTVTDPQRGLTWRFEARDGYSDGELPLVSVTDRTGHEITYEHDEAGRPVGVAHSGGYRVRVSVTDERVSALTLAGRDGDEIAVRRFDYDEAGNLSGVRDSADLARRFEYDGAGRLTARTDRNGHCQRYSFDAEGRCVRVAGPSGELTATFDYQPGSTRRTSATGAVTGYEITESGQVAAVTDSIGKTARTEYDERGRVTGRIDPLGRVVRYAYDERGNLVSVINPDGHETRIEFDEACLPVRVTVPDGNVWLQAFDKNGNLTELTAPGGSVLTCGYDSRGHLAEVTGFDGALTTLECDGAGLPVSLSSPTSETIRYQRDELGRVVRAEGPGGATVYGWTSDGRPASRTLPDASNESWTWDGEGNLLRRVSATGSVTSYGYGQFDELVSVDWPGGTRSEFEYDQGRCLASVTHGGLVWRYEHDSVGRLSAQTDYNSATTQYWYDAAGQLVHRVIASGHESSFGYDLLGNLASHHIADGTVTAFGYDAAGRLISARDDEVELVFVRDSLGRVITERCNGREVSRSYDPAGRLTRRVTPSGAESTWHYDAAGLPSALTAGGREIRFGYDAAGREIRRELPGDTVLTQEWDELGQLMTQALARSAVPGEVAVPAAAQLLQRRAYLYAADGFVTGLEDLLSGDRALRLDSAGRVTAVSDRTGTWSEQYDYDLVGNLVSARWPDPDADSVASTTETSAQGARVHDGTLTTRAGQLQYRHDAAGRVISRTLTPSSGEPQTWRYAWDADSRLFSVALPDGSKWRYQYDPIGRRIGKSHLGADGQLLAQTHFAWDGRVLAEQQELRSDGEQVTTWHYRGDSLIPVAQTSRTVARAESASDLIVEQFHSVVTDLSGTPSELVCLDGTLAGNQQHTLWGQLRCQPDAATTPLRFPGHYFDQESGLLYHDHRYYDPETGGYLSPELRALAPAPNPHAYLPNPVALNGDVDAVPCDEAATLVCDLVSELEWGNRREANGFGPTRSTASTASTASTIPADAWTITAQAWVGARLLASHRLPVSAGIDGFDARLFAGGPGTGDIGFFPTFPLPSSRP